MPRKYRLFHKRKEYKKYADESEALKQRLKCGELNQEQYERAMEMCDDKYRYIR